MPTSIVLTPTGSGQTGISTGSNLVTKVARIVGGEDEPNVRAQALDCLNRARIEFNQYDWKFTKQTDDPITLVSGTQTYSLQSAFKKPSYANLIDAAGDSFRLLQYIDPAVVWRFDEKLNTNGTPYYYTMRNDFDDGLVTLHPIPDTNAASLYRLVMEYYPRLGAFSDDTTSLSIPEEAENALVLGGQAYIIRERNQGSPAVGIAFQDYQRAMNLLKTFDRRITDEQPRFTLRTKRPIFDPTLYIRVS